MEIKNLMLGRSPFADWLKNDEDPRTSSAGPVRAIATEAIDPPAEVDCVHWNTWRDWSDRESHEEA